jgi:uncharacterized membrane protein YfcA
VVYCGSRPVCGRLGADFSRIWIGRGVSAHYRGGITPLGAYCVNDVGPVVERGEYLNAKAMAVPMITRLPGTVIGVWLLTQMSITALQIIVSSMVLLAVIVTYWAPHYPANRLNLGIAGAISGLTGATTAIGGPPMAIVMQHGDPRETRANLSLYFTYSCIVSLIGYYWAGLLHLELLVESMSFAPIILIGYFIGVKTRYLIDAKRFRSILMFLCLIAGVSALIGALW